MTGGQRAELVVPHRGCPATTVPIPARIGPAPLTSEAGQNGDSDLMGVATD